MNSALFLSTLKYSTPQVKTLVIMKSIFLDVSCLNCPVLRTLILNTPYICVDGNFIITAPRLKYFLMSIACRTELSYHIVVGAPNLETLVVKGYLLIDYLLEKISSLSAVEFDPYDQAMNIHDDHYKRKYRYRGDKIARGLSSILNGAVNIKCLTLSASIFQVYLSDLPPQLQVVLRECHNLRHLKLAKWSSSIFSAIRALFELGKQIPRIETVVLERIQKNEEFLNLEGDDCIENLNLSWESTFPFLKFVQMKHAEGSQNELKLLEAILRGSMVLEEISIKTDTCLLIDKGAELDEFVSRLQLLRKASLCVKIYLNGREIISSM